MQRFLYFFILAGAALLFDGCKTDQAVTQRAEQSDSRPPAAAKATPLTIAPSAASVAKDDGRPLVVCFGDSLTAGYGTEPGQSYPDYLETALDKKGYKYRVVNEGVSGDTTKDGINRLDEVVAMKAAVVVVEFGGNDGLRGLPIQDSRSNLDTILGKLTSTGSKVLIAGITLPPNYGEAYIKQFDATYPLLAKKYDVPLLPFLFKNVYGVPGMMQADETHATAAGNKIVAENVLTMVTPLLKK